MNLRSWRCHLWHLSPHNLHSPVEDNTHFIMAMNSPFTPFDAFTFRQDLKSFSSFPKKAFKLNISLLVGCVLNIEGIGLLQIQPNLWQSLIRTWGWKWRLAPVFTFHQHDGEAKPLFSLRHAFVCVSQHCTSCLTHQRAQRWVWMMIAINNILLLIKMNRKDSRVNVRTSQDCRNVSCLCRTPSLVF